MNNNESDIILRIIKQKLQEGYPLTLSIASQSMKPLLPNGTKVQVYPVTPHSFRKYSILCIQCGSIFRIHRFIRMTNDGRVLTRGDQSRFPDPPVSTESVIGEVKKIVSKKNRQLKPLILFSFYSNTFGAIKRYLYSILLKIRGAVISLAVYPRLNLFFSRITSMCIKLTVRTFGFLRSVETIYLTRSMALGGSVPGMSDIDLFMITANESLETAEKPLAKLYPLLRIICPMLSPPALFSEESFLAWTKSGGTRALEIPGWKLLKGKQKEYHSPSMRQIYFDTLIEIRNHYLGTLGSLRDGYTNRLPVALSIAQIKKHLAELIRHLHFFDNGCLDNTILLKGRDKIAKYIALSASGDWLKILCNLSEEISISDSLDSIREKLSTALCHIALTHRTAFQYDKPHKEISSLRVPILFPTIAHTVNCTFFEMRETGDILIESPAVSPQALIDLSAELFSKEYVKACPIIGEIGIFVYQHTPDVIKDIVLKICPLENNPLWDSALGLELLRNSTAWYTK